MSKCAQGTDSGANFFRNSAAVMLPAKPPAALFTQSALLLFSMAGECQRRFPLIADIGLRNIYWLQMDGKRASTTGKIDTGLISNLGSRAQKKCPAESLRQGMR